MTYTPNRKMGLIGKMESAFPLIVFFSLITISLSIRAQPKSNHKFPDIPEFTNTQPPQVISISDSLLKHEGFIANQRGILLRSKGQGLYILGKYEDAGICFSQSVKELETGNPNLELGLTFIEQAKLFRKLKMFKQAIDIYSRAYKNFEQLNDKNNLATVLNEWGVVYEMMKDYPKAINYYNRSLELKKELNDTLGVAYSYGFLSYVNLLTQNLKAAEDFGNKSFGLFQQLKIPIHIALQSSDLALIYEKKGDYYKAINYLNYSDSIAEQMNYADLKSGNYERLARLYATQQNFGKAYHYQLKFSAIKDSLFTAESQKNIAELNVQYKTAEKDKNLALKNASLSQQKFLLAMAIFLLILTVGLIAYISRNKRVKEKQLKKEAEYHQELLKMEAKNTLQQERLRISRDLHDNIGSYLTYIKANIDDLLQAPAKGQEDLDSLKVLTTETISELRRMVWLINKPAVLLEEWVIKLRDHFRSIPKIHIHSTVENSSNSLSALEATMLFRIIQEATNNALKYSGGSLILIKIEETGQGLSIKISDDGIGFNLHTIEHGYGLNNMKQRAKEISAQLTIDSQPDKGTDITILLS